VQTELRIRFYFHHQLFNSRGKLGLFLVVRNVGRVSVFFLSLSNHLLELCGEAQDVAHHFQHGFLLDHLSLYLLLKRLDFALANQVADFLDAQQANLGRILTLIVHLNLVPGEVDHASSSSLEGGELFVKAYVILNHIEQIGDSVVHFVAVGGVHDGAVDGFLQRDRALFHFLK
jgi:hypothetical protein